MTSVTHGRRSRRIRSTPPDKVAELHGARAARALELDLDDAGFDIGPHQHEVAPVGLHGRPHEVHDRLELAPGDRPARRRSS